MQAVWRTGMGACKVTKGWVLARWETSVAAGDVAKAKRACEMA